MFTFDIAPDGREPYRVVATSRDLSFWERTGKDRSLARLESNARMADLEEIAFTASKRRGLFEGSLADFREACDITPLDPAEVEDEDEAGPTRTAR